VASTFTVHTLGSVCTFVGGGTPSRQKPEYFLGGIPWATVKDFKRFLITDTEDHITEEAIADSATNLVEQGTVLLVSRVGLGKVAIAGCQLAINQDIKALTPNNDVMPEYLFWFLLSKASDIVRMGAGATVQGITLNDIKALQIPVPPLPEQRRIVDLLSRAEGIVRLRREAEKKAAELIPALFLDMFGDPATNPKGWANTTFGTFGESRLGKMLDKQKQSDDYQRPYLRNVNVQWDRIDTHDLLTMDFRPEEQNKFLVRSGDVLICEGGEIGRAAIWHGHITECFYQKALHKLTPDLSLVRPDFVVWLLWHLANTGALLGSSTHATIAHLTGVQLKGLNVICPPIELQSEFENRVDSCHSIQSQQSAATAKAQATFAALLAGAFSAPQINLTDNT